MSLSSKSVPKGTKAKVRFLGMLKLEKQAGLLTLVIARRRQQPLFYLNTVSADVHSWF